MINAREHIDLRADPETVFGVLTDARRVATVIPHLTIEQDPSKESIERFEGGYDFKLFGLSFSGTVRTTDYQVNGRIVWVLEGALRGSVRCYVEAGECAKRTRLTVAATYRSPGSTIVRLVLRPLLQRRARGHVHNFLERAKRRIERTASP